MKRHISFLLVLAAAGCGDSDDALPSNAADAVASYAAIVHASYQDSHTTAQSLASTLSSFLAAPTADGFEDAKDAWLASREPYLQTETYRFYDGPIDHPETGPEGLLNAWPLDEAYIDYVDGDEDAGLVNDTSFTISEASIEGQNELGGEENISAGYHAVEFLLWGQDLSLSEPGQRPYTDYLTSGGTAENQARRGLYLETATALIVGHLAGLVDAWAPNDQSNYRAALTSAGPREALRRIFTGLVIFSANENGGERLVGIETGDPNDEHSCFSDNTHRDFIQNQRGVQNVFMGRYTRTDGTVVSGVSLYDVVAARDQALADQIRDRLATSLSLAEAIQVPFEAEFQPGNTAGLARLEALRQSLVTQGDLLEQAMELLGLPFSPPEE